MPTVFELFSGSGEVRALMRTNDWSASPLGDPARWPQALRLVVSLMLDSKFPMFVAWGAELGCRYNDAYAEILGQKHPAALGRRFQDIWYEIWSDINPIIERALSGEAIYASNLPLVMMRHGHEEKTWFTFSYSPMRDESGAVAGMFCAVTETTDQVNAARRLAFQLAMADRLRGLAEPGEIIGIAAELLGQHLGVARAGYGEVDAEEKAVSVLSDWTDGSLASIAGQSIALDAFGPASIAALRSGKTLRVDDIEADARSAPYTKAYAGIGTRAMMVVPLIKNGRLTSILSIGASEPRRWTEQEISLAEDVGERAWAALEHARAGACVRAGQRGFYAADGFARVERQAGARSLPRSARTRVLRAAGRSLCVGPAFFSERRAAARAAHPRCAAGRTVSRFHLSAGSRRRRQGVGHLRRRL